LFLVCDSNMPLMVHFHKQAPFLIGKEAVRSVATQMYAIYRLGATLLFFVGLGLEDEFTKDSMDFPVGYQLPRQCIVAVQECRCVTPLGPILQ
jgi:hypothetical protein